MFLLHKLERDFSFASIAVKLVQRAKVVEQFKFNWKNGSNKTQYHTE